MLIAPLLAAAALAPPFTAHVDNPYFPVQPGMRWVYRGVEGGKRSRDVVKVTAHVEIIAGVPCATVRDRLYLDGRLAEDTRDWYSQDAKGTVWYFGEDTKELDRHGRVTSTEGSWRAGVHGAREGIIMPARPRAGQRFQQEFLAGHAEDRFRVMAADSAGVATREFTPLEPGVIDRKWYAYGIGNIREKSLKGPRESADLVEFSRG
jgi:hypothetical protein